ncbi:MAG: N-methyl-L-tryptophan oxidase, partial [Gammaproteobacteria bacterium]|nr:N-methyl-L-tryptophan oxidase [Gammaproteobacteria bacterium]
MDYDAIVIGVGAMGAATLEQLSRRGVRALGVEQSSVPNASGSSGGDTRLIRKAYFEHPDYVPLLERAYDNWRDVEARSGERLLFETGAVYIGPPDGDLMAGSLAAAREHGLRLDELSAADVERLHPQFRVPRGLVAGYEPAAGFVMSGRSISAFASLALQQGAHLSTHTRVEDWEASASGVRVVTSQGTFSADRLVIAGGSWNSRLLQVPDLSLTVTRQPLFWTAPNRPSQFALDEFPCWAAQSADHGGVFYGFPGGVPGATQAGVKFAHHFPGRPCLPDGARPEPGIDEYRQLLDAV